MSPLPTLTLDTDALPPAERLAAWRAAIPQYAIDPLDDGAGAAGEPGGDFHVHARAWLVGNLIITHTRVTAVALTRGSDRIGIDGADTFNLNVMLRGALTGSADGRDLAAGPGQLIGLDLARPLATRAGPSESVSVVIARDAVREAWGGEPDLHGRLFEGAAGQLLSDHCLALARHLPSATAADAGPIARATLALLAAALPESRGDPAPDAPAGSPPVPDRVGHAIRQYIDRHLGEPDLGPERITRSLGLSRATLYRSMRATEGIAAHILRRRLQAVRALLLHPAEFREIGEIARSLGFANRSHFAAAFRREFGCTPREVRSRQGLLGPALDGGEDVSGRFREWLSGLASV